MPPGIFSYKPDLTQMIIINIIQYSAYTFGDIDRDLRQIKFVNVYCTFSIIQYHGCLDNVLSKEPVQHLCANSIYKSPRNKAKDMCMDGIILVLNG